MRPGDAKPRDAAITIDSDRAQRVIDFIQLLTVPSGEGQGQSFKLLPFEKKFIRDVYGPHRKRRRTVRRAILSIARKNGKTALIAALVLVHLVGPEAIENGEIYSAANERDQAAQIYKVASQIVRADPELESMLRCIDSTKTIVCYSNGSFYRAISSEAGSKHGLNPSVVIFDELAQARNRELYDVLDTSMGARQEPLFITISTQSNDPQHILSELIDDGLRADDPTTVTHLHAVDEAVTDRRYCRACDRQLEDSNAAKCPKCGNETVSAIYDEAEWPAANPALGVFRSLDDMRAMAARAMRMPSFESSFRNLYLNQRVDAKSPLIARPEWMDCKADDAHIATGEAIYIGLDLSGTTDLTAMVAVSANNGDRVQAWFWKPEGLIREHQDRDRVPYMTWQQQGYLTTTPGRSVDYGYVARQIAEIASDYTVLGIAYDRWRIENLLKELVSIGVDAYVDGKDDQRAGAIRLVPWGQGFRDMAPAIDALEISVLERRFRHDGNPVLTWCFSNAIAVSDPANNRKLDKSKTRFRIDGAQATTMAIGLKARDMASEPKESVYEQRGISAW